MKKVKFFLILFFLSPILNAQQLDSTIVKTDEIQIEQLEGRLGPSLRNLRKSDYILIVNGFIISDTVKIKKFTSLFRDKIKKIKFYSSTKGFQKFGISSKDGILFCKLKDNIIIDWEKMERIKR